MDVLICSSFDRGEQFAGTAADRLAVVAVALASGPGTTAGGPGPVSTMRLQIYRLRASNAGMVASTLRIAELSRCANPRTTEP